MPQAFQQVSRFDDEPAPPRTSARPSETAVILPIAGALTAAERWKGYPFIGTNDRQRVILQTVRRADVRGALDSMPELKSIAAPGVDATNRFLRDNGFPDVQLRPLNDPLGFSAASVLDLLLMWAMEAKRNTVVRDGVSYDAADWAKAVFIYSSPHHSHPIAQLDTKTQDKVFVTLAGGGVPSGEELADHCAGLKRNLRSTQDFEGLRMPMITYDGATDLNYLVGMPLEGTDFFIGQALQRTRVRLNEKGVRVQSAAAVSVMRGGPRPKPRLVLDAPFLLWIERPGLTLPILAGYFAPDSWKDPGTLD